MRIVLAILLAVFIPLGSFMVVISSPVCEALAHAAISQYESDPEEIERLVDVAMAVRDFSLGNDSAAMPTGEDYRTSITLDALYHLLDVRVVFLAMVFAAIVVFIALAVLTILAVRRSGATVLARSLIIGGAAPLAAALLLGIAVMIDFSAFFTWMHGLFFADGTWTFPADSLLIRALPYEFWVSCAVVWASCMIVACIICLVAGLLLRRRANYLESSLPK